MKHFAWFTLAILVSSIPAQSQEQKQAAPEPIGNTKPCLVVKHKGTVGRRLLWTALIGIPIAPGAKYDHVDAINFQKAKPSYKGKELQEFQAQGVRVMILKRTISSITCILHAKLAVNQRARRRNPSTSPSQPTKSKRPNHQLSRGLSTTEVLAADAASQRRSTVGCRTSCPCTM